MKPRRIFGPSDLADVEERASAHVTFQIPPREERESLCPTDLVKLVFERIGARVWVQVSRRCDDGTYVALAVDESFEPEISEGDEVSFGPEHVADVAHVALRRERERLLRHRLRESRRASN